MTLCMEVTPYTHLDEVKKFIETETTMPLHPEDGPLTGGDRIEASSIELVFAGAVLDDDLEWQDFVPFTWLTAQVYIGAPKIAAADLTADLKAEKKRQLALQQAKFDKGRYGAGMGLLNAHNIA